MAANCGLTSYSTVAVPTSVVVIPLLQARQVNVVIDSEGFDLLADGKNENHQQQK